MGKKVLAVVLCLIMTLALLTGCKNAETTEGDAKEGTSSEESTKVDPVKIAVVNPLSGASADCGRMTKDGAELFKKVINEAGGIASLGGAKVEIDYYDCTSDPAQTKAVTYGFMEYKKLNKHFKVNICGLKDILSKTVST
ncbi:MAG: ABC transporter substrate-binding protein [Tepidanaerobacteraceae bacterium]